MMREFIDMIKVRIYRCDYSYDFDKKLHLNLRFIYRYDNSCIHLNDQVNVRI